MSRHVSLGFDLSRGERQPGVMRLELIEQHPGPDHDGWWQAFELSEGFTPEWWSQIRRVSEDGYTCLQVVEGDVEVARVELDDDVWLGYYVGVPTLRVDALEVQFIEVHSAHLRRGIGRRTLDLLRLKYPERALVAFSEDADEFWGSLGWSRHLHRDDDGIAPPGRPLYVDPAGTTGVGG